MERLSKLYLAGTGIKDLPSSIQHLTNLSVIWLYNSKNLRILSSAIGSVKSLEKLYLSDCNSLTSLPETICHLICLKTLILTGCSNLKKLPENLGDVESLEELYADGTAITVPPPSIGRLKNLKVLRFGRCEGNHSVGLVLPSLSGLSLLTELHLSDCNMLDGALPSDIGNLSSLEELNLGGNNFLNLPESINRLSRLEILRLVRCKHLEALPRLPSNIVQLTADECPSLKDVPDLSMNGKLVAASFMNCFKLLQNNQSENMAEKLLLWMLQALVKNDRGYGIFLPGIEIPQYFSHQNPGHSITIQLQPGCCWCLKNLKGIALCIVGESTTRGEIKVSFIFRYRNGCGDRTWIVFRRGYLNEKINFAHMFLTCLSIKELRSSRQSVSRLEEVFVENGEEFHVKKIGIRPLYQGDTDGDNTIKSSDDRLKYERVRWKYMDRSPSSPDFFLSREHYCSVDCCKDRTSKTGGR